MMKNKILLGCQYLRQEGLMINMVAIIFNGKEFAREKEEKLVGVIRGFGDIGKIPKLVAILIGDNPESELYLRLKEKAAKRLGIEFEWGKFSGEDPEEIIDFIEKKNNDPNVTGMIVELPLPEKLRITNYEWRILNAIDIKKDIDCLTEENLKLLKEGKPRFVPPTVKAVGDILKEAGEIQGKSIVVVGSEGEVGRGLISYLRNLRDLSNLRGIDQETKDLSSVTKDADILISATGKGHLIKKEMVKSGAIVIDVGIEKKGNLGVVGDVDFEQVKEIASFITPVPGGVGPITIACLMENLIESVYH